ncbi:MAG: hypothetical protein LBC90_04785 [Candidatus Adiutrix sp.]|jgi:hypothetical protein|nr:hypothetical protein [Candidatus Adiutrix sp.]
MNHANEAAAGARRVRLWTRLSALVLTAAAWRLAGDGGLAGAALGALVVEVNLSLLVLLLDRAPQWQGRSLRGTLARFYLSFLGTALVCFLIIHFHLGHPLAFLAGLLAPVPGLALALISFTISPPPGAGHDH